MGDLIEVSYTGDLLAHRRCPRAWAYEKQAGFHPYEQVQAMEGRLVHHAMEWLTRKYSESRAHAGRDELEEQLRKYFRVLWARGIRTAFTSKAETIHRVMENLFPEGRMHQTVKAAIEGAQHTEYELRTVRKLMRADFGGKSRLLLTGILDLVIQQENPLTYENTWEWKDLSTLTGEAVKRPTSASPGDLEIWDYKATRAKTPYVPDYVRQLLTYAALFKERGGELPKRCIIFFVNEQNRRDQLLAIPVDEIAVASALDWTINQVRFIRKTVLEFQVSPTAIEGAGLEDRGKSLEDRFTAELKQQCTACGFRFDCKEYCGLLGGNQHPDVRLTNVKKN